MHTSGNDIVWHHTNNRLTVGRHDGGKNRHCGNGLNRTRSHTDRTREVQHTCVRGIASTRAVEQGIVYIRRVQRKVARAETRHLLWRQRVWVWILIVQKRRRFTARIWIDQVDINHLRLRECLTRHRAILQVHRRLRH